MLHFNKYKFIINLIIVVFASFNYIYSYEVCDSASVRGCIGRSLKFTVTTGKGAHYVDVVNNSLINKLGRGLTFDLWMKPQKQTGKLQYIGGLWGPNFEVNDSWVVFIDENDSLNFRLNGGNPNIGNEDFTTVKTSITPYYNSWNHFAFVFDGTKNYAYIYINGNPIDSARNPIYPLSTLKRINNPELSIQLGSTNALSNDPDKQRTFLGDMDEIRIWGKALLQGDIYCNQNKVLVGTENSLLLYYRCNHPENIFDLCDAAGNGNIGLMRSGLKFGASDRKDVIKVIASPLSIKDTIICDTERTYDLTITDTSVCSTGIYIRTVNGFPEKFRLIYNNKETVLTNWNYIPLVPLVPTNLQIKVQADFVGTITTLIQVRNANSCSFNIANIPVSIDRQTELVMNKLKVDFDSLKARCIEKPYIDSTIKICNSTDKSSNPKNLTISNLSVKMPQVFKLIHNALPIVLKPGECTDVTVRFTSRDTTFLYLDTLQITSTDRCANLTKIPLKGKVKEVLQIFERGSEIRLTKVDFGTKCVNFPSFAVEYEWKNVDIRDLTITNIIIPNNFYGKNMKFPLILEPNTGYQPNFFRFLPKQVGNFNDSIIIVGKSGNCTIHYPIYIKGVSYDSDISFIEQIVDFGNIKVGQEITLDVKVQNKSSVGLNTSTYLINGDPFFISGSKALSLPSNSIRDVKLTFRPTRAGTFVDELEIYEESCYQAYGIKVIGKAYIDMFSYEPEILQIDNVLACKNDEKTLEIRNLFDSPQTLTNFNLIQSAGKFTLIDPPTFPNSITLNKNQTAKFKFRYTPNDITAERADKAFLEYKTQDNQVWSAKLLGTSVLPRLYLTSEILYETIEVGGTKQDTIIVENISNFNITINNVNIPNGFNIVYPTNLNGRILNPKDTIQVLIDFVPTQDKFYSGKFEINIIEPCPIFVSSELSGRGIIVPLDAPLKVISYGFVKPCDCEERRIPLINNSFYFPMEIDSILIDSVNVSNAAPQFYSWYSFYSPNGQFPYQIPKRSTDTLTIRFCPNTPFIDSLVDNNARLHIYASGSAWNNHYETYLAGKQTQLFKSDSTLIVFPPTRVDTVSAPRYIHLFIPDLDVNPQQVKVEISGLGFEPDERVFYAQDSLGRPLNLFLDSNNVLTLRLEFKPRAVRFYENKLKIAINSPCVHFDTSVTLQGSGFAPAFGLNFSFNNVNKPEKDTLRVITCDTLTIPVYSSRTIPADVADIKCRIGYDTSKLEYLYSDSYYLNNPCISYQTSITHNYSDFGGSEFLLKNACYVDSIRPIFTAYFRPKLDLRDTLEVSLDSIKFDTEEIILYHLIAEPDFATVVILKPEMKAVNSINFDSVRVLDCASRTIEIVNTGDVPITAFNLLNLPPELKIISAIPQLNELLDVGDTIKITLEYCPRKADTISDFVNTSSVSPCFLLDSNFYEGIGYAPELNVGFDISMDFIKIDTVTTQLADTTIISIYNEKDFSSTINSTEYWIEKLNFDVFFNYNPFNLEFIEVKSDIKTKFNHSYIPGELILQYRDTDTLKSGKIAEMKFLSVVPDTNLSDLHIEAVEFRTDSILFLDIKPIAHTGVLYSLGKCGINTLDYTGFMPNISQNSPNPFSDYTTIKFVMSERSKVNIHLYSINGQLIEKIIDSKELTPGEYEIKISAYQLNSGIYYYTFETATIFSVKSLVIVK